MRKLSISGQEQSFLSALYVLLRLLRCQSVKITFESLDLCSVSFVCLIFLISVLINDNLIFLGIIYIGKALRYPKIILNDYEYQIHIKTGNRTRWRCRERNAKCKAILYTSGNTVSMQHDHNHPKVAVDYTNLVTHKVNITREKIKKTSYI